ncbi:MAG: hypothetical protein JTT13_11170 [Candidatus Brockarchaeota archaeon]|nr:hypothetical protein [Candidatus Brockarchaeota archaeon]
MVSGTQYGEIELNVGCGIPSISYCQQYVVVELEGFHVSGEPGNPELPNKFLDVLLPPDVNTSTIGIHILLDESYDMNITAEVMPASPLTCGETVEWGTDKVIRDGKNLLVYGRGEYYPDNVVEVFQISNRGIYVFARIRYNPIQYNPLKGRLRIHKNISFKITYGLTGRRTTIVKNKMVEKAAEKQFVNWNSAKEWYSQSFQASGSQYDYIIVTTNAIKTGSSELNNYVNYLQNTRGFKVKVITEDDYGLETGQQRAINIRNWLKNNYLTLGITYVLLIGNPDPDDPSNPSDSYGDVPMMMCWPRVQGYDAVPTDYFYADLTGNWNTDGDIYYGEYGQDTGVDFTPEVYVGRIPVYYNNYAALDNILRKIMSYVFSGTGWRNRIMLPVAISNYANEDNQGWQRTDGLDLPKNVVENILPAGWSYYVLYERSGRDPVPETAPYFSAPLTKDNVINEWKKGYGVVFWFGHGSTRGAYRKYWSFDDGDGVPESGEMNWTPFFSSSDATELNDSTSSFVFQCSCDNGYPEDENNLGYALLRKGAVATVSSSRVSWYIIGYWRPRMLADNVEIGYRYVEKLVKSKLSAGIALYEAKGMLPHNEAVWWMNMFDFNLYGDPSLSLFNAVSEITVDSVPHGSGFVKVDGQLITTPRVFTWEEGSTHLLEAVSPIYLENWTRYVWHNWSDGRTRSHNYTVPSFQATVTAFFNRQYNVTFNVKPAGCGTVTPSGSAWFNEASTIRISATPGLDYVFRNWFTDTSKIIVADPNSPDTNATINGPGTVVANFTVRVASLTLKVVESMVQAGIVNVTVKIISPNNITGAGYAVDDTNSPTIIPFPIDGSWDSSVELVRIRFNASLYSDGFHTIYVRASDTASTSDWLTLHFHSRSLVKRYNLIAPIFKPSSGYSAEDLGKAIGPSATLIAKWDSATQKFKGYSPGVSNPGDDFPIEQGFGYFVYLTSPCRFIELGVEE